MKNGKHGRTHTSAEVKIYLTQIEARANDVMKRRGQVASPWVEEEIRHILGECLHALNRECHFIPRSKKTARFKTLALTDADCGPGYHQEGDCCVPDNI